MTKEEMSKVLAVFSTVFSRKETFEEAAQRTKVWQMICSDLDYETAQVAAVKLMKTAKFEPRPADLIEATESLMPKTVPDTESAWIEVCKKLNPYKAPQWSHPLIGEAVKVLGYRTLCDSENPEWDRQHFIKVYERMVAREKDEKVNQQVLKACGLLEEPKLKVLAGGLPDKR